MALTPGTRLGPYEIQAAIGAGGMGEVYLARDTRLNRNVALKSLSGPSIDSPAARDRLLREARAAAQLTHPNIAAIHDVLDTGPFPCIVMEYVQGESLAAKIARGPLSSTQTVLIGVQLADALAQAHAAGVVHRDLKPANVQVTPDGTAKILDFGLARSRALEDAAIPTDASDRDVIQSQAGKLTGTPAYMAPEQLMGKPATPASDVYGLGVLLFEALTGRRPFEAPDFLALAMAVLSQPTPSVRTFNPGIPQEVNAIVSRAMARRPSDRYPSAAAMAADLHHAVQTLSDQPTMETPVPVQQETLLVTLRRRLRRRRTAAAAGVIGGVLLLAALAIVVWQSRVGRSPIVKPAARSVAVARLINATGDPSKDNIALGVSDWLATRLASVGSINVISRDEEDRRLDSLGNAAQVTRKLDAELMVVGSVQQADDYLRFAVRIVKPDGSALWAGTYEDAGSRRVPLMARMTDEVAGALGLQLTTSDHARFQRASSVARDAWDDYSTGQVLLDRQDVPGNLDKAIAAFKQAAARDSAFAPALAGLGDAYWAKYRATKDQALVPLAVGAVQDALKLDPDDPDVRVSLAAMYAGTGKSTEAVQEFNEALKRRPRDDNAHRQLAEVLRKIGRPDDALKEYLRAIEIRPNYFWNYFALGGFYYHLGRYAEAAMQYQRMTELEPDGAWGYINLGAAYIMNGENEKALASFQRANEIRPDETTISNIGAIYYAEGRYPEAVRAFGEAIRLGPNNHVSHRNLGDAYLRMGQPDRARAEYERAAALSEDELKINPRDASALACHAVYDMKLGRTGEAVSHVEQAAALAPDDVDVLYKRAVVYALAGQPNRAVPLLAAAVTKGYSRASARTDDDLDSIRKLAAVEELLSDRK